MKILVINGHPNPESFNHALADAFIKGASIEGKNEVRYLQLANMEFNPNLSFGYSKRVELEADLIEVQEWVKWCEHLVSTAERLIRSCFFTRFCFQIP